MASTSADGRTGPLHARRSECPTRPRREMGRCPRLARTGHGALHFGWNAASLIKISGRCPRVSKEARSASGRGGLRVVVYRDETNRSATAPNAPASCSGPDRWGACGVGAVRRDIAT